jgi:hypothetical protein
MSVRPLRVPLDIALLDSSEAVVHSVPIGVDAHWELVRHAERLHLELLLRLRDYYEEAVFFHQELAALVRELDAIARERVSPEVAAFSKAAVALCQQALALQQGLHAIPD